MSSFRYRAWNQGVRTLAMCIVVASLALAGCDYQFGETELPPKVECLTVQPAGASVVEDGLKANTGATVISPVRAVRSPYDEDLYYLAARIGVPSAGSEVGVWAKTGPLDDASGLTMSVNDTARGYSKWPDGADSEADVSSTDSAATDAKSCIE